MAGPISTGHISFDAKMRGLENERLSVAFCLGVWDFFRKKTISHCGITVFLRYVQAVGIVDCLEYLFSYHIIISS